MRKSNLMKGRSDQLGWIFAAALLGVMAASGFHGGADKNGVVDIAKVVEQSTFGKANQTQFAALKKAREDFLESIDQNRVLTNEQAPRLKELTVKDAPTDAEKAEIEKIKADVVASAKKYQDLAAKAS